MIALSNKRAKALRLSHRAGLFIFGRRIFAHFGLLLEARDRRVGARLRFGRDAHGRVLASALRERVYDGAFVAKLRAWLHCYDRDGRGSLSEADLERYVGETMPALQNIDAKFCPFYVCTAVRRVVFFVEQCSRSRS